MGSKGRPSSAYHDHAVGVAVTFSEAPRADCLVVGRHGGRSNPVDQRLVVIAQTLGRSMAREFFARAVTENIQQAKDAQR